MARFPGVDYFLIDSQFSEEELLVRQTARQFVDDRVLPLIRDCFRDARFPSELIPEMGRLVRQLLLFPLPDPADATIRLWSSLCNR